ncbi:hypothetical protein PGTUg99_000617 [Puccinia graminis f. sp. tritici]|uniref:DNA polymerase epsilon subunit D n=1 Tax=Puccinia graminis f. sp. tritici TaxID=56615 RepID=A0A5B0MJA6_PUCGR|nr:hypothetical protein PGTUg99_000617 [Puccinia graminis f. sp. tritici]
MELQQAADLYSDSWVIGPADERTDDGQIRPFAPGLQGPRGVPTSASPSFCSPPRIDSHQSTSTFMPKVKKIVQPPDVQQSLGGHQQAGSFVGIEAVELPRAVVMKLAKSTGPGNMKLAKEVPVALTKASTVFINYLVAIAHDIAAARSEKSLNARHVLEACKELQWPTVMSFKRL